MNKAFQSINNCSKICLNSNQYMTGVDSISQENGVPRSLSSKMVGKLINTFTAKFCAFYAMV